MGCAVGHTQVMSNWGRKFEVKASKVKLTGRAIDLLYEVLNKST